MKPKNENRVAQKKRYGHSRSVELNYKKIINYLQFSGLRTRNAQSHNAHALRATRLALPHFSVLGLLLVCLARRGCRQCFIFIAFHIWRNDDDDDIVVTAAARDVELKEVTQRHVQLNRHNVPVFTCTHSPVVC